MREIENERQQQFRKRKRKKKKKRNCLSGARRGPLVFYFIILYDDVLVVGSGVQVTCMKTRVQTLGTENSAEVWAS